MIDRIHQIIKEKGLNLSAFAEEIGVQRSSISHILSGRNKPSLDFIMKILDRYPEISTDWLISGKGSFKEAGNLFESSDRLTSHTSEISSGVEKVPGKKSHYKDDEDDTMHEEAENAIRKERFQKRKIRKIIILYEDGTFEEVISR